VKLKHSRLLIAFVLIGGIPQAALAAEGTVFHTAFVRIGSPLGGLTGADAMCQSAAESGELPGAFVAWLSTTTVDAVDRLTPGSGPFLLPSGTKVADDIADLTDGTLDAPINENRNGDINPSIEIATATLPNGTYTGNGDCNAWTSASAFDNHIQGLSTAATSSWTLYQNNDCNIFTGLYCFEVVPPTPVPATGVYGLIAFALLVAGTAGYTLRRAARDGAG